MKNPLHAFRRSFIKHNTHNNIMGNNNNKDKNLAAPDGQTASTNGAPNRTTVVAVDAQGNPVDPRQGNLPNQPPGGNTNAIGGPGENNNQDNLTKAKLESVDPQGGIGGTGSSGTVTTEINPNAPQALPVEGGQQPGLGIEELITKSTKEIKSADEAQNERVKKQERLMTALNSRMYMEEVIYKNEETQEELGRKLRYTKDPSGKTIYDYMNDPEVQDHLGFKIDENDPQDGSFIEKQISVYWINPVF